MDPAAATETCMCGRRVRTPPRSLPPLIPVLALSVGFRGHGGSPGKGSRIRDLLLQDLTVNRVSMLQVKIIVKKEKLVCTYIVDILVLCTYYFFQENNSDQCPTAWIGSSSTHQSSGKMITLSFVS
jgi:hypothetical protein